MAVNPNWPLVVTQFSTADPFDPGTPPVWNAFTPQPSDMTAEGGRQYELDLVTAGEATLTLFDQAEALNPANTAGTYYPNIKPLRQVIDQAMWPPAPVGGAVNLLNANALPTAYDPGFESSAVGSTPSWVTPVGGTNPVVGTTTPHSGSQDLTYTVAGTTTPQGASWPVQCIPGQQYTASGYVQQTTNSPQQIGVGGLTALDRFQRTGALNGSTSDTGQTWSFNGGVAGDYTTTANPPGNGSMAISNNTTNVTRYALLGVSAQDFDFTTSFTIPAVATGAAITFGPVGRFTSTSNTYWFLAQAQTSGNIDLSIFKIVSGTLTQVGSTVTAVVPYSAGTQVYMRAQGSGTTLQCKLWLAGTVQPTAWTLSVTDAALTGAGQVGVLNKLNSGNTNGTVNIVHGPLAVTSYSTPGSSTGAGAVGSYVRLSVTFTATQPVHTVAFNTIGTATAGTVLLDDIQHEVGSTANTFSSTGPNIVGVFGGFIERWPRSWKDGGVRGQAKLTCVDALAVLSNQFLQTEYRAAVLVKRPSYYWTLGEPQGASMFAEISGNNGPPLARLDGYFGPGPTFAPGTQTNIPGDPSGTGLSTDQPASGYLNLPVSIASTNLLGLKQPVNVGSASNTYNMTVSAWITHPAIPSTSANRIFLLITSPQSSNAYQVIWQVDGIDPTKLDFSSLGFSTVAVTDVWADGKPHHFVHTVSASGGNVTGTVWVDGVQVGTNTATWASIPVGVVAQIGGAINPAASTTAAGLNGGVYSHFAVWNRQLSNSEIADLWNAGKGYPGETPGARVSRYLGFNWIGPTTVDTGQSIMGVSNLALNTSVNDACQSVATSENGRFFVDATNRGGPAFQSRTRQYLNTSAKWVLGEQELPYEEDIEYDFDDQQIWNDVQVTRVGGVTAVGGTASAITTSQNASGKRSYPRQVNVQDDQEAQNAANWIFTGHAQAVQRLAKISIKPSSNPALWQMALSARQGDRITVHRRTSAGTPMVADFFIEKISHDRKVDDSNMEWTVSFEASPFSATRQPWILGDATYGVLGSTTLLAY